MTTKKMMANGRSIKAVSVAEVRNSRTDSNSLSTLARLPVLPKRTFILMSRTCSNSASAMEASACALAMSKK